MMQRGILLWVLACLLLCCFYFASGYVFIRQVGPQEDEVQFVASILRPYEDSAAIQIGPLRLPLMVDNYAGATKAIAYLALFSIWPPDVYSLRVPVLLVGTLTVFLYCLLFRRIAGYGFALAATALLVADPLFSIMSVLDFGIVVVQHLLTVVGFHLALSIRDTGNRWLILALGLVCGIGLWDKMTFLWLLVGFGLAAWIVFRPEIARFLNVRTFALLLAGILVGSAPLTWFWLEKPAVAAAGSGGLAWPPLASRLHMLRISMDGSALFPMLAAERPQAPVVSGATRVERTLIEASRLTGHQESHLLLAASLLALLLLAFARSHPLARWMFFCALAFVIGFLAMLPFAKGAAGSQHTMLLWPLPHMLVAGAVVILASRLPRPSLPVATALVILVAASEAFVTCEYYARIVAHGPRQYWSNAIHDLRAWLAERTPGRIYCVDWGIAGPLRTLGRGTLPLDFIAHLLENDAAAPEQQRGIGQLSASQANLFISYVDRGALGSRFPETLRRVAADQGYQEELVHIVADRYGRPVYRIVRFRTKS